MPNYISQTLERCVTLAGISVIISEKEEIERK
jgi:hypothetical protein